MKLKIRLKVDAVTKEDSAAHSHLKKKKTYQTVICYNQYFYSLKFIH